MEYSWEVYLDIVALLHRTLDRRTGEYTLRKYNSLTKLQVPLFFHALQELHSKFPVSTILADADVRPPFHVSKDED